MTDIPQNGEISSEEMKLILKVLEKDEEVHNQEETFINDLRKNLSQIIDKSVSVEEEIKDRDICVRCKYRITWTRKLFTPLIICSSCSRRICFNCNVSEKDHLPICIYCDVVRKIETATGAWFFKDSGAKEVHIFNGTHILKKTLLHSQIPKVTETDKINNILQTPIASKAGTVEPALAFTKTIKPVVEDLPNSARENYLKFSAIPRSINLCEPLEVAVKPDTNNQSNINVKNNEHLINKQLSANDLKQESCLIQQSCLSAAQSTLSTINQDTKTIDTTISSSTDVTISGEKIASSHSKKTSISSLSHGVLTGSIKCEKYGKDKFKLKLKIAEAVGLKPLYNEAIVSSYVIVRVTQNGIQLFKEKTSIVKDCSAPIWNESFDIDLTSSSFDNFLIFLLLLKPSNKHSIKNLLSKQKTDSNNNYYGSVRIGIANYISDEEQNLFKKLNDNFNRNITDWIDFKISLNRAENSIVHPDNSNIIHDSFDKLSDVSTQNVFSTYLKADDQISFQSLPSQFYANDQLNGKIYVGLKYSDNYTLIVDVIKAEAIVSTSKNTPAKVFAKCKILCDIEQSSKKTIIVKNTFDPIWNSSFIYQLDHSNMCANSLSIIVYSLESFKKVFCGQVLIPIGLIIESNANEIKEGYSEWYDLGPQIPISSYGFKGTMLVSLRYDPISYDCNYGNLEVRVQSASNIQLYSNKIEPLDTYVRSMLLPNTSKKECKKSDIINKTTNPEYKFSFSFYNISRDDLRNNRCLEISIWTKSSKFIGGIRLCKKTSDTFLELWQDSSELESNLWCSMINKDQEWVTGSIPIRYTLISQNLYPSLIKNVEKVCNDYMRKNGLLTFKAIYNDSEKSITIEINDLIGLKLDNFSLVCYIKLRTRGEISKRDFYYLNQTSPNQWNKSVTFVDISHLEYTTIEIRLIALKLQSSAKKNNQKQDLKDPGQIVGRILLSRGLTREPWDTPSNEEMNFYNLIITTPNTWHSKEMHLNYFAKTHVKSHVRKRTSALNVRKSISVYKGKEEKSSSGETPRKDRNESIKDINDIPQEKKKSNRRSTFILFKKKENFLENSELNSLLRKSTSIDTFNRSTECSVNCISTTELKDSPSTSPLIEQSLVTQTRPVSPSNLSEQQTQEKVVDNFIEKQRPNTINSTKPVKILINDASTQELKSADLLNDTITSKDALIGNVTKSNISSVESNASESALPASADLKLAKNIEPNEHGKKPTMDINKCENYCVSEPLSIQDKPRQLPFKDDGLSKDMLKDDGNIIDFPKRKPFVLSTCECVANSSSLSLFILNSLPKQTKFSIRNDVFWCRSTENNLESIDYPKEMHFWPPSGKYLDKPTTLYDISIHNWPKETALNIKDLHNHLSGNLVILENCPKLKYFSVKESDFCFLHRESIIIEDSPKKYTFNEIIYNNAVNISHQGNPNINDFPLQKDLVNINSLDNASNFLLTHLFVHDLPKQATNKDLFLNASESIPETYIQPFYISDHPKENIPSHTVDDVHIKDAVIIKTFVEPLDNEILNNKPSQSGLNERKNSIVTTNSDHGSNFPDTEISSSDISASDSYHQNKIVGATPPADDATTGRSSFSRKKPSVDVISVSRLGSVQSNRSTLGQADDISDSESVYGDTKISGEILVGFKYLAVRNQLVVTIKQVTNVGLHDHSKKLPDPYVKLHMLPGRSKSDKHKTKAIKNSQNPFYNENFTFTYNMVDLKLRKLNISVWHRQFRKKIFMGEIFIPMGDIISNILKRGYVESWYPLEEKSNPSDIIIEEVPVGQLELEICLEKNSIPPSDKKHSNKLNLNSTLKLKIIEARNIASIEPVTSARCKILLQPDKSHKSKKKTTQADNSSGRYIWNSEIAYEVDCNKIQDQGIELKIFDSKKKTHILGSIHLNSGTKVAAWQDATSEEADIWNLLPSSVGIYQNFILNLRIPSSSSGPSSPSNPFSPST